MTNDAQAPTFEDRRRVLDDAFAVVTAFKADRLLIGDEEAIRVLLHALWLTSERFERVIHLGDEREKILNVASDLEHRIVASFPCADVDDQPPARELLRPSLLLMPLPWRTYYRAVNRFVGEKVTMLEDGSVKISRTRRPAEKTYRRRADAIINGAARTVIANPDITPSDITTMQMVEHYWARGEALPDIGLKALAFALGVRPHWEHLALRDRVRRGKEAGEMLTDVATDHGISTRSTRARKPKPMKDSTRAKMIELYDRVVASRIVTVELRREVAEALGLLGDDGDWRAGVHEHLLGGMREPDEFRRAAAIETMARLTAGELDSQLLDARTIARRLSTRQAQKVDRRKIERWMARSEWEPTVQTLVTYPILDAFDREVAAKLSGQKLPSEELAKQIGVKTAVVEVWRGSDEWKSRIDARCIFLNEIRDRVGRRRAGSSADLISAGHSLLRTRRRDP